jgi:hypothetical protein
MTIITSTLSEQCTFLIISVSHSFLELKMYDTKVVQKIKTHFIFDNIFFFLGGGIL